MAEASYFKFGAQLGFAKTHQKPHPEESCRSLGLGELPNIWGSPLIFQQRPRCPLSVSGASCYICTKYRPTATIKYNARNIRVVFVENTFLMPPFHGDLTGSQLLCFGILFAVRIDLPSKCIGET